MIRKWSYLENDIELVNTKSFLGILNKHRFKIFKKTTKFKKYHIGISKSVMFRKKYAKRKHYSNYINRLYITKYWMTNYLKMRQFVRFYQAINMFNVLSYSPEMSVFSAKANNLKSLNGINYFSCSYGILNKFLKKSNNSFFLKTQLSFSLVYALQTTDIKSLSSFNDLSPNIIKYDNLNYPTDSFIIKNNNVFSEILLLQSVNNFIFKYIIRLILLIRNILVLFVLLHLK